MTKTQWRKRQAQWRQFNAWERKQMRQLKLPVCEAFRLFDELYRQARALGSWRKAGSLGDLEPELRIAVFVNRRHSD